MSGSAPQPELHNGQQEPLFLPDEDTPPSPTLGGEGSALKAAMEDESKDLVEEAHDAKKPKRRRKKGDPPGESGRPSFFSPAKLAFILCDEHVDEFRRYYKNKKKVLEMTSLYARLTNSLLVKYGFDVASYCTEPALLPPPLVDPAALPGYDAAFARVKKVSVASFAVRLCLTFVQRLGELMRSKERHAGSTTQSEDVKTIQTLVAMSGPKKSIRNQPRFFQYVQARMWDDVLRAPFDDMLAATGAADNVSARGAFTRDWLAQQAPEVIAELKADYVDDLQESQDMDALAQGFATQAEDLNSGASLSQSARYQYALSALSAVCRANRCCLGALWRFLLS
jgi:hypothetical protein